jgi:hypothetical protein
MQREGLYVVEEVRPPSLADRLRAKRTEIVREANRRTREIDLHIDLLEKTSAVAVLVGAVEALEKA